MHKKTVIDFKDFGLRQVFKNPLKELKTKDINEVKPLLAQVEAYQKEGYYAVGYLPTKRLRPLNLSLRF